MKLNMIKKIITTLVLGYMASISNAQDISEEISTNISKYFDNYPEEKITLITDKSTYKPGEKIWFKALITNNTNEHLFLSKGLSFKLFDRKGNLIINDTYLIDNGSVSGASLIPSKTLPGEYMLFAYSSWMENGSVKDIFRKTIRVATENPSNFNIQISTDKKFYNPEDTVNIEISTTDFDGDPISNATITLKLIVKNKTQTLAAKTNGAGQAQFNFIYPNGENTTPVKAECTAKTEVGLSNTRIYIYPEPQKLKVSFATSGNKLVINCRSLLLVQLADQYGNPYPAEGDIINSANETIGHIKTDEEGMGATSITPKSNSKLFFKLKNKSFELPAIVEQGASINLIKKNQDSALVKIETNGISDQKGLNIIAISQNKTFYSVQIPSKKQAIVTIPVNEIKSDKCIILLVDNSKKIISLLPFYIGNDRVKLDISTDKAVYSLRDKANVKINCENGIKGIFTIAVSSENENSYNLIKSNRIDYSLLFKEELNHWQKIITNLIDKKEYTSKDGLQGVVLDKKSNPIKNANVKMFNPSTFKLTQINTDTLGWFEEPYVTRDIHDMYISISATSENNNPKSKVYLLNKFEVKLFTLINHNPELLNPAYKVFPDVNEHILPNLSIIEEQQNTIDNIYKNDDLEKKQILSSNRSLLDAIAMIKPYKIINGKITFRAPGTYGDVEGAMFVIDGALMGANIPTYLHTYDIDDIKIYTNPAEVSRYSSFAEAIIEIKTKDGRKENAMPQNIEGMSLIKGYKKPETYQAVEYISNSAKEKDTRTSLLWIPENNCENANEKTFTFYTSDIKGKFKGVVFGLTQNGQAIIGNTSFIVK